MRPHSLLLCSFAVPLAPTPLLAQGPLQSRSPLAGAAVAVMVDGGLGATDAQTRVHTNGFALLPTAPLPNAPGQPDLQAIFQAWNGPPGIDADDWSLGRDDVLVDANGFVLVPPNSWGVLTFSLRAGATGSGGTSRITQEVLGGGNVGSALFTWMLPGSNVPPQFFGPAERSHSARELGIPAGAFDVDAVDLPAMLGRNQATLAAVDPQFTNLIVQPESLYFTVSEATKHLVPVAWWGSSTVPRSGATIFVTRRPSPTAPYQQPSVFRHFWELGLGQLEDIDGLAYDRVNGKLLFSCVGTARDQFLFLDIGTDGGPPVPVPVRTAGGTPVSTQVGKGVNDDVDAVCTLDPRIGTQGGPPPSGDDFGSSCGVPRPGALGVPSIHAAAYRRYVGGTNRIYDSWMIGWPPATGITAGIAFSFVTLDNDPTLYPIGPIQLRNINPAVPGDPRQVTLGIPPGLALSGTRVTFRWAAFDAAFTELAEAWPVLVFL
jgi:hypothetical protein